MFFQGVPGHTPLATQHHLTFKFPTFLNAIILGSKETPQKFKFTGESMADLTFKHFCYPSFQPLDHQNRLNFVLLLTYFTDILNKCLGFGDQDKEEKRDRLKCPGFSTITAMMALNVDKITSGCSTINISNSPVRLFFIADDHLACQQHCNSAQHQHFLKFCLASQISPDNF